MGFRLRPVHAVCLATAAFACFAPVLAGATEVGGGGGKATDCLGTLKADVTFPAANPRHVRCVDGTACDADSTVDGACTIPVIYCVNSTYSGSCTLSGVQGVTVDHAIDNGEPKFDPDFQALQSRIDNDIMAMSGMPATVADLCTAASNLRVPIKGPLGASNACSRGKTKVLKITTKSELISGRVYNDVDVMRFQCDPNPVMGCDPQTLWPGGTFERIQKQVFNQNCAVSGCHDSQSIAGGLLLETGASYNNLKNQNPVNIAAFNAGWKRVTVTVDNVSGDPATSYIIHKLEGDLPDITYGERMPLHKPKLHATLRDIIEKWILNGAPSTGWVAGTF